MSTKKFGIVAGIVLTLSVVVSPAFAACSLTTMSECDNNGLMTLIAQLLGGSQTSTTTTTTGTSISGIPAGFTFTTNLKQGSTGNDVKYLQVLLNSNAATSIGNAGKETTYFGAMTKAAVVKFQNAYKSEVLTPYGLSAGTGFFGSSSRAKANALISSGTTTTTTTGGTTTTTTPVVGSGFTVALASSNPVSGTLVQGQATANLANYTFSNGTSSAVSVTSVTLDRIGVSADATLTSVYLFDGAVRLTDAASISAGKVTFNTVGGIFSIPANSTKTISVKSDILSTANGQTIGVALSAVTSNGTLASTLPVSANLHNIASATLADVAISAILPGSATTTDPVAAVRVWESTFTVGQRNVQFTKLALKQINSIDKADISNFQLLVDGVVVSTVASLDANNYVTFTFDKTLTTGGRNIKVLADVTGGSSRYIQMSLRNKADIDVKDADYGVNVAVTPASATASTIQVNNGVFTITTDNTALPVTVANNSSNILIGKFKFKAAGEAIKVETLTAGFTYDSVDGTNGAHSADGGTATLRNAKIMIAGAQAGSTTTMAKAGTSFTVNYTFQPGVETVVEVYADIYDNDGLLAGIKAKDVITAKLVTVSGNGTKQISLGTINVPTANKSASAIIVSSGSATLTTTSNYGTQNTALPQTAFKIGSWTLTADTAENINVNGLSFAIAASSDGNFTVADMSDMYVTYQVGSGSAVTTSVTPTPTATTPFSTSFTLPKAQTATINLYASMTDNAVPSAIINGNAVQATLTVTGTGAQSGTAATINALAGQSVVYAGGSLTISKAASTPVATLVTGNNTVKTVSYKFEALNDSYTISQLTFSLAGTNGISAVSSVNLKEGTTILSSAPAAATVTFNLPTAITIAANTYKTLDVEVVLGTIGSGNGTSSADVVTDFTNALARPSATGTAAYTNDVAVTGNDIYVYKAIPTITLPSLPSGNLASGTNTISKFTVASDTGTIAWKKIAFAVSKSDASGGVELGALSNVTLWNGSTQIPGRAFIPSATLGATGSQSGTITFIPDAEEQVAGSTTYSLKADVGGTAATGDSINTKIDTSASSFAASTAAFAYATPTGATTFAYYDADGSATVNLSDIRQTAVSKYTTADVTKANTVAGHNAAGKITEAYGFAAGTITFTEGTTDNTIGAATATLDGMTCTPFKTDGVAVTVNTTLFSDVKYIVCSMAGKSLKVGTNTAPVTFVVDDDVAVSGSLAIVVSKPADYALNTVVAAADSDASTALGATSTAVARAATFVWSDLSQPSHSISTADWTTDFLVKNLATDTQNLTK